MLVGCLSRTIPTCRRVSVGKLHLRVLNEEKQIITLSRLNFNDDHETETDLQNADPRVVVIEGTVIVGASSLNRPRQHRNYIYNFNLFD